MSDRRDILPKTPFIELSFVLGQLLGRDANLNNVFETFIAGCDPSKIDTASLNLSLSACRQHTSQLAEIYHLIRAFADYEPELRAWFEQRRQLDRSPPAAA